MSLIDKIDKTRIPRHVAIIMDGNGRWAKKRGMIRSFGHENGVPTVHNITEVANDLGVEYLTLYTFSTENWNRPQMEVDALMHLVVTSIEKETPELIEKNVRLTTIGDMERVPEFARTRLQKCMADTAHCTGMELCLALSYSSRWEIVEAVRGIANEVAEGKLKPADIDDAVLSAHMLTAHMPDPTCLSAQPATCESATTCCGRLLTVNSISRPFFGQISLRKISWKPSSTSRAVSADLAKQANR